MSLPREQLPPAGEATAAVQVYQERRDTFAAGERQLALRSSRLSLARGAVFLVFAGCLLWALIHASAPGPVVVPLGLAALAAFTGLVVAHDRLIVRQRRQGELRQINEHALDRLARAWDRLPLSTPPQPGELPPLARDLDLVGRASLFQLLGTAHTPLGRTTLRDWLLHPAPPAEIAARQEAAAELAPELDMRQRLEQGTRAFEAVPANCEPFLSWAEDGPWLLARPWLVWLTRALGAATLGLGAAALFTSLPAAVPLLLILGNVTLSHLLREPMEATFNRSSAREQEFLLYAGALETVSRQSFRSPWLQAIQGELAPRGRPAHLWMDLLHRRVTLADARHSASLHFLLQTLTLWDFHTLYLLEAWRRDAGRHARRWLGALGRLEALATLAGLHFDNPDWSFPRVEAGLAALTARELGHPLIAPDRRVGNDVTVGPAGSFLLVTGSNMSGKSTLLRALGVNMVLAQAGGPVCAAALAAPPLTLATSILIEDSLAGGISFFMAELLRIRQVVDAADRCHAEGRTLLYLLDEVLRGTNSEERQIAVRRVVLHLLGHGALGAVSTHDLDLAALPALAAACQPVHFRETILVGGGGPPMSFDYRLRPGVATTVNALKLLALVGLDLPEEPAATAPPEV
ncbi:MAG: DNA mismatch repair protein MutS [Acidobacteriota bacterium]|nr:DNA mismatch repair protein MutS [Acidobacteriota bacterium]